MCCFTASTTHINMQTTVDIDKHYFFLYRMIYIPGKYGIKCSVNYVFTTILCTKYTHRPSANLLVSVHSQWSLKKCTSLFYVICTYWYYINCHICGYVVYRICKIRIHNILKSSAAIYLEQERVNGWRHYRRLGSQFPAFCKVSKTMKKYTSP